MTPTGAIIPPYRSPDNLRAAVARVDPIHAADLQPGWWPEPPGHMADVTWCNKCACRILLALGVSIPKGMLVNDLAVWFSGPAGRAGGWRGCSEGKAMERAAGGYPVVAVWANPSGPHGHIGVGVPGPAGALELHVAAAGATNHDDIRRSGTFGPYFPSYFMHD